VGENLYLMDVAIAIDHMALAARDAGVGSCWIGAFDHAPIKELIGVPKEYDVVMLLVLGYPAEAGAFHTTTERLGREQVVFGEKWAER